MAADEVVVERRPRPANRWTDNNPLTPLVRSPPVASPSELNSELVELGVPTVGGFSILYLRNSAREINSSNDRSLAIVNQATQENMIG